MLRFSLTFRMTRLMRVLSEPMSKPHHLLHLPVLLALHVLLDAPVDLVEDPISFIEGGTHLDRAGAREDQFHGVLPAGHPAAAYYRDLEVLVELIDARYGYRPDAGPGKAAVLVGEGGPSRLDLDRHRAHGVDRGDPV